MAVREFDGVDDFITLGLGSGGLSTIGQGAFTVAILVNRTANDSAPFGTFNVSQRSGYGTGVYVDHFLFNYNVATDWYDNTAAITTAPSGEANEWQVVAATKAAGTVAPRGHKYRYSTTTWSHANASTSITNGPWTATTAYLGRQFAHLSDFSLFTGRIAVVGVWNSVLSDTQIETLEDSLQNWVNLAPVGLWALNQAATTTAVEDITGNGANQTAITGTTVVTGDDPPGFTFGLSSGTAQAGSTHLGLTATATAVKVAAVTGIVALGLTTHHSQPDARQVQGVAHLGLAATAVATKVAVSGGVSALGLAAWPEGASRTAEVQGESYLGLSTHHSGVQARAQTGITTLGLTATATLAKVAVGAGNTHLGMVATGTAVKTAPQTGVTVIGLVATGTAVQSGAVLVNLDFVALAPVFAHGNVTVEMVDRTATAPELGHGTTEHTLGHGDVGEPTF